MQQDLTDIRRSLENQGIDVVRLIYADLHGIPRSKDLLVSQLERSAFHGPAFCEATWVTTMRGDVLTSDAGMDDALPDMISKLDAGTMRPIPWVPGVAYAIADLDSPDGSRSEIAPRAVLRAVLDEYDALGLTPICGPELEFYFAREVDGRYERLLNKSGQVYTTGAMVDPDGHYLHLLRMLDQLNVGAFAGNHEFCPSQYEINLWHSEAMDAADRTFLFKTAIKDVLATRGVIGTFIGKPWSDEGGSGFHVHLSMNDGNGVNLMHDSDNNLSELAFSAIAGILKHAPAIAAFTNPTVNSYKRLGPDTMAPYRANWGYDNRSAMIRIPPDRGPGTRLELRIGDGSANPYIVIAVVLAAALDGIKERLTAPKPVEGWSYATSTEGVVLPMSLTAALDELNADADLRNHLSPKFIDAFTALKRDEAKRYAQAVADPETREVTQWELEEYIRDL